jgi:hypothetical protein
MRRLLAAAASRAFVALVAFVALAACATYQAYEGPRRPAAEVATIHGDAKLRAELPLALVIRSIDGHEVDLRYSNVAVSVGHHELIVDCQVGGASGSTSRHHVEFDADGGASYRLHADMRPADATCQRVYLEPS